MKTESSSSRTGLIISEISNVSSICYFYVPIITYMYVFILELIDIL